MREVEQALVRRLREQPYVIERNEEAYHRRIQEHKQILQKLAVANEKARGTLRRHDEARSQLLIDERDGLRRDVER